MMETHVLPNLRSLLAELRRKASDTDREWVTLDKEFQRDLDLYVKLAGQLKTSLAKHNGEYADGPEKEGTTTIKDPWAANISKGHSTSCMDQAITLTLYYRYEKTYCHVYIQAGALSGRTAIATAALCNLRVDNCTDTESNFIHIL